jgi:hypothetical protein
MSETGTSTQPAPHRHRAEFRVLLFGAAAAPLVWMGHLWLSYGLSSRTCFPADMANAGVSGAGLRDALLAFDAGAIVVTLIALAVSYRSWRTTRAETSGRVEHTVEIGEGRTRFLAVWGMISSLMFLVAVVFAAIASVMVPLCGN